MKLNFIVIPLITILVAGLGGYLTSVSINSGWYDALNKPLWTPAGNIISAVWTILFILATISALIFYNKKSKPKNFKLVILLFVINAVLNVFWSYLFFYNYSPFGAFIEIFFFNASIIALIILMWEKSKTSAILLIPYTLWVSFATYLNYTIWILNIWE